MWPVYNQDALPLREFAVDLHVHTCLSACGSSSMIPPAIIAASKRMRLDGIGITDHNSAANVGAVAEAAQNEIAVFGGMEIMTREEIHLLVFFGNLETLGRYQEYIEKHLEGCNDPDRFGPQYIVDKEGYITETSGMLLSGAVDLSIDQVVGTTHDYNGIAIAAHIDRESYSIVSQLGFIPESLPIDAVEIAAASGAGFGDVGERHLPVIASSDAHSPEQIGLSATGIRCERLTFEEFKGAIAGKGGRSIRPIWK